MKQVLFFIPLFFILALLQTSFFAHFTIQGFLIPVVLIAAVGVSVFDSAYGGLWGAFAGGLVLDVFSQHVFGYWAVLAVLVSCVVSFFTHTYVRIPNLQKNY